MSGERSEAEMAGPRGVDARAVVILTVESAMVLFVCFFAWMMSGWFADDAWAVRASDADWVIAGGVRFAGWLVGAVVVGCAIGLVNHHFQGRGARFPRLSPLVSGIVAAGAVALAAGLGAVRFVTERPWF